MGGTGAFTEGKIPVVWVPDDPRSRPAGPRARLHRAQHAGWVLNDEPLCPLAIVPNPTKMAVSWLLGPSRSIAPHAP